MSSEELAVSLWNETDLVCKLHKLLESIVKDEFEVKKAVNQFEKKNIYIYIFAFDIKTDLEEITQRKRTNC
jgi:hypothetical protein